MSEADRMFFEGLGYEKVAENDIEIRYIYDDGQTKEQILFNPLYEEVTHYDLKKRTKMSFSYDEIKAAYLKLKELGVGLE